MQHSQIKATETAAEIAVSFPYSLRDAFRAIFKTAPWDSTRRVYSLKNTILNKNKLAQFFAAAEPVLPVLSGAADTEASEQELARMREAIARATEAATKAAALAEAYRHESAELKVKLVELKAMLDPIAAQAATAKEELQALEAERQIILAPVKALLDESGVPHALSRLRYFSRCFSVTRVQKEEFNAACRTLRDANKLLATKLGITLPALNELREFNPNRLDKTKDALIRYSDIYAGMQKINA